MFATHSKLHVRLEKYSTQLHVKIEDQGQRQSRQRTTDNFQKTIQQFGRLVIQ